MREHGTRILVCGRMIEGTVSNNQWFPETSEDVCEILRSFAEIFA